MGGKYVLCQELHPWLNLTADFYMLFLIPLFRRVSLRPQGGTDCLVQLGHENALYEMLPSTQSKTREDGKISPLTRNLVCYLWQWGTNNTQQKDDFFFPRWQNCFQAWCLVEAHCECLWGLFTCSRTDQTRPDSLAVSQRYNEQEYSLSLSLSVYTHTYSTIFHSNTPKQTPNCLQYFREIAKALRYFPYCPLEQTCVFISTKVEICIVERKEISFRREHKQKQVLIWSGSTDPSRINAKAEH